ncbi:hypothetical protein GGF40_002906 [Coemansia sp. RSA 1286]|nr:hypothetical protein GGF40_002906 [Coemansia sp. RSA 1286]
MVSPSQQQQQQQQRPSMAQFRPGVPTTPQQHIYMANNARNTPLTMSQYTAQQQQQQQQFIQQGMVGQPRPIQGMRQGQQPTMYTGNTNINISGVVPQATQQHHPALIQPSTPLQNRKRKSKHIADTLQQPTVSNVEQEDSGDEVDKVQPYGVSLARYQNNHNLMSEVFVALPTSTIKLPGHYYQSVDKQMVARELEILGGALEMCEKEHGDRIRGIRKGQEEFAKVVGKLKEATAEDIDKVKGELEALFAMEFVNNPYRTVERVPVSKIDAVEDAVYRQL